MGTSEKSMKSAENVFLSLLVIGLIGLLFLIIYGNLSGNLGFTRTSTNFVNITGGKLDISDIFTITQRSDEGFVSWSVSEVWNSSDVENDVQILLNTSQYVVDAAAGTISNASNTVYPTVNLTYTVVNKGSAERNTDGVITNLTSGATQFFTFSNVWFVLTAITVLIGIVLGVIALVRKTSGTGSMGGSDNSSRFTT